MSAACRCRGWATLRWLWPELRADHSCGDTQGYHDGRPMLSGDFRITLSSCKAKLSTLSTDHNRQLHFCSVSAPVVSRRLVGVPDRQKRIAFRHCEYAAYVFLRHSTSSGPRHAVGNRTGFERIFLACSRAVSRNLLAKWY